MSSVDYMIYKVLEEYKQEIGFYENVKFLINPDDFRNWLYGKYNAMWHPGNPDYINFGNDEAKVAFMLKWG